ncbi:Phthiocerol synthesis polyketide synthase type I PpsC [Pseudoruegeria aquimaris]|uniref:Phthiocerol synthesis polyketide synthase type I PpsC n=1 Tax=Pseudoruegeria aquimaris TaxID=393663 RepID=A0A1Y5RWN4_9RHOB|nr:NADPH:quinone oxidoreductase family protein [Pseudoruegeria aquimaris]SLN25870.1 Phthiocerol synthesis polyketide synthase type I PpsC [Pseudoruegeria aquimaris]
MLSLLVAETGKTALAEVEMPEPAAGEVRLKVAACALNFADLLMIKGTYQDTPPLPFTPGMEVAGVVEALGAGVSGLQPGDRVACFPGRGGLAQHACVPAELCVPLPEAMPFHEAAAFQVAYGTSHLALEHRARMQPGETLLVTGAAGGVGLTAVEIGKLMGARVIACARGPDKLAIARAAGADHLIDSTTGDLRAEVKALGGADVVYEAVGGQTFKDALRACNPEARMIPIGFAGGEVPQIPANHLLVKNITVIGLYWGGYLKFAPDTLTASLHTLFGWYGEGRLRPHVSHRLPLTRAEEALELLRSRASTGKVVVEPWS